MFGKHAFIAAGVAALLAIGGAGAASAGAAPSASGPRWHITKTVSGDTEGGFNVVVATGKSTGWAFEELGDNAFRAWELSGGTWARKPFPAKANEVVDVAAATSPSDVWVVTMGVGDSESRVLRFNGHAWSVVKVFSQGVSTLSVLSASDVWVFGFTGAQHYNGRTWTRVGVSLGGASVLSDHDIWGFSGTNVLHWNGRKWTATSMRSLLPAKLKNGLNDPEIAGILALSASDVYVTGNGNAVRRGGPIAVLHYDGRTWSKVAQGGYGWGTGMSPDGHGGLWIPISPPVGLTLEMLHYAGGKLTTSALPGNAWVTDISRVPGTTRQLAAGMILVPHSYTTDAVILQYS